MRDDRWGTKLKTIHGLNKHFDFVHEGKKPFKCKTSCTKYTVKQNLNKLVEFVHEGKNP